MAIFFFLLLFLEGGGEGWKSVKMGGTVDLTGNVGLVGKVVRLSFRASQFS